MVLFPYSLTGIELAWLGAVVVLVLAAFVLIFNVTTAQDLKK